MRIKVHLVVDTHQNVEHLVHVAKTSMLGAWLAIQAGGMVQYRDQLKITHVALDPNDPGHVTLSKPITTRILLEPFLLLADFA
jgi:hypothetical protein